MIVVKERRVRRVSFAGQRFVCRSADKINVEPAIVVVVDQANAGALRFKQQALYFEPAV